MLMALLSVLAGCTSDFPCYTCTVVEQSTQESQQRICDGELSPDSVAFSLVITTEHVICEEKQRDIFLDARTFELVNLGDCPYVYRSRARCTIL